MRKYELRLCSQSLQARLICASLFTRSTVGVDLRACMARRRAGTSDAVTDVVCAYGSDHPLTQYFSNSAYETHVLIVCWFKVILYITVPPPPFLPCTHMYTNSRHSTLGSQATPPAWPMTLSKSCQQLEQKLEKSYYILPHSPCVLHIQEFVQHSQHYFHCVALYLIHTVAGAP